MVLSQAVGEERDRSYTFDVITAYEIVESLRHRRVRIFNLIQQEIIRALQVSSNTVVVII